MTVQWGNVLTLQLGAISSSLSQLTSAMTSSSSPLCRVCSSQPGWIIPVLQGLESGASQNWALFLFCNRAYLGTETIPSPPLDFVPRAASHALLITVTRIVSVLVSTLRTADLTELTLAIPTQQEFRWALWPSMSVQQLLWCRVIVQDSSASKLCDCYWKSK